MNEKEIFGKINGLLADTDFPLEIRDTGDLADFLADEDNRRFEAYETIGRYYDELVGRPDIDRYGF